MITDLLHFIIIERRRNSNRTSGTGRFYPPSVDRETVQRHKYLHASRVSWHLLTLHSRHITYRSSPADLVWPLLYRSNHVVAPLPPSEIPKGQQSSQFSGPRPGLCLGRPIQFHTFIRDGPDRTGPDRRKARARIEVHFIAENFSERPCFLTQNRNNFTLVSQKKKGCKPTITVGHGIVSQIPTVALLFSPKSILGRVSFLHTFTFQLLVKPWSQVSSLLLPGSCL